MSEQIEYRVRPVTRYIVTRFAALPAGGGGMSIGSETRGEYDNPNTAYEVGYALCKAEHERLGWPLNDPRITYPFLPDPDGNPTTIDRAPPAA